MPRIRSESPAFDLHHPEIAAAEGFVPNDEFLSGTLGAAQTQGRVSDH